MKATPITLSLRGVDFLTDLVVAMILLHWVKASFFSVIKN